MYKILLFLILLPILCFSQDFVDGWQLLPSAKDSIEQWFSEDISDSIAFPVDTLALQQLNMAEGRVAFLKEPAGWFSVVDSTAYFDAHGAFNVALMTNPNIFSHPTQDLIWGFCKSSI